MESEENKYGIEYTKVGDYFIPNLIDSASVKAKKLGKYGRLRLKYLLEHKKYEYTILWANNKLRSHLLEINKVATERLNLLISQLSEKENITENLKETNQMEWVCKMNNIKNRAEEIVLNELIFV